MAKYNKNQSLMKNAKRGVDITDPSADLPTFIELDQAEDFVLPEAVVDEINEFLADKYGFCNNGWCWKLTLDGILWNTEE